MENRELLFEGYLTRHLSHVADHRKSRQRKKAMLLRNYSTLFPARRDAQILEIGPGFGELLEILSIDRKYSHVHAIDLSQEVADFCNQVVPQSTSVVKDSYAYLVENPGRFDRIFLLHVLEHIPKGEVILLLSAIRKALAPGGMLVLEVPNMGNPLTGLNIRYADFTHEAGFTELSMAYVLNQAGFTSARTFATNLPIDRPSRLAQRLLQYPIRALLYLAYRAYALPCPQVLSAELCAVAEC